MTSKEVEQELGKDPFVPLRLHLVGSKTMDVRRPDAAWLLHYSLLVVHPKSTNGNGDRHAGGYDVISLRHIERIEQRRK